jgi:phage shock protein A
MQSIRDPETVLSQALVDMQNHLRAIRPRVAAAIADERLLVRRLSAESAESALWEGRAMQAVRAGDDELARAALIRKAEADRRVGEWRTQLQDQRQAVERLKGQLRQLQDKLEQARRQKHVLVAKARRAMAAQQIQATIQGINGLSAFDVLSRIDEQVDRLEAETEAQLELTLELGGEDRLAARFAELEQRSGLDDELAALKRRMALPMDDELAALKVQLALERPMVPVRRGR